MDSVDATGRRENGLRDARGAVVPPWGMFFRGGVVCWLRLWAQSCGTGEVAFGGWLDGLGLGVCGEFGLGAVEGVVEHFVLLERELVFAGVVLGNPVE